MQTIKVSATKARNDFFNLFNLVLSGTEVLVEKDKKHTIKMTSVVDEESWAKKRKRVLKVLEEVRGSWKDVDFKSPLRGKWALRRFGNWDKK